MFSRTFFCQNFFRLRYFITFVRTITVLRSSFDKQTVLKKKKDDDDKKEEKKA